MSMRLFNSKYSNDILAKAKTWRIPGLEWQDIAQELDIALWLNLQKFQGLNGANERTFVLRVLRNKLTDLFRNTSRRKRFIDTHHFTFSQLEQVEVTNSELESAELF